MNDPSCELNYRELKAELTALQQKIEDVNSRLKLMTPASPSRDWRWHSNGLKLAGFAVVGLAALAIGAAAAAGDDPLTISPQGNVGINQRMPKSPLDVNGNAAVSGELTAGTLNVSGMSNLSASRVAGDLTVTQKLQTDGAIYAGNSDMYFTKTDHDHSGIGNKDGYAAIENSKNFGSLMILGRYGADKSRSVGMWDSVGIRTGKPEAPLDVRGEIRGKLWYSAAFEWKKDQPAKQMTKADHSACFLTLVSGYFYGAGEKVHTFVQNGYWYLGGEAQQRDVRAEAVCIGAPDSAW